MTKLPGEGDVKLVERTRVRVGCSQCGEPATQKHTYLLPDARRNSASTAYGRDDCSWCSDHEEFTCEDCGKPRPEGYEWCSTFSVSPEKPRFAHMFLRWDEREIAIETRSTKAA